MISRFLAAAGVSCVLATAGLAQNRSVVIDTRFVDFDDPDEVGELYNLIVESAERICDSLYRSSDWRSTSASRRERLVHDCMAESVDNAVDEVGEPTLNDLHASRGPVGRARGSVTILVRE